MEGLRRYCRIRDIPTQARTDMVLSIIEASRFSDMHWKRLAVDQAKVLTIDLDDNYAKSCLAQNQSLLHRLSGETNLAFSVLPHDVSGGVSGRLHATYGHTLIQRALNHVQVDQLDKATDLLKAWQPMPGPLTLIEQVVLFRQHLLLGKILRYRGDFTRSLSHLQMSINIKNTVENLIFLEDASDLVSNLADTYIELDCPGTAEICLRAELERQNSNHATLTVALAESMFAQEKFDEAKALCLTLHPPLKLLKMEKLRLSIVQAKLSHVECQYDAAVNYWTAAMAHLNRFTLACGRTTRIILLSQRAILRRQGHPDLERQTSDHLSTLEIYAGACGALYWIAGLRHWLEYLESVGALSP